MFKLVTEEGHPDHVEARELIKKRLQELIDRVDEDNLVSMAVCCVGAGGNGASGRAVSVGAYTLIGLLEYEKAVILGMIEDNYVQEIEGD